MRRIVKNTLIIALLYIVSINNGHAFDIDETVDDEIRKNYNSSRLINDVSSKNHALAKKIQNNSTQETLPDLPNITKTTTVKSKPENPKPNYTKTYQTQNIKIKKGTTFTVYNTKAISDWQAKGTKVVFKTNSNYSSKKYNLKGEVSFTGEIIESHQPQITCNGGLVAINIYSMNYKGMTVPLNAYVVRADDKKIFFNTIKGERNYIKTVWKKGNWGRVLFNKMLTLTMSLGAEGSTLILSPFPFAYGTICLGANALTSPICAFFSKGGHVSIPANSTFKIKLEEDAYF